MLKKQIKSYTLSEEVISLIDSYSKMTGNSQSQSIENLILSGIENITLAKSLSDKITQEFKNIINQNKKDIDRLVSIIIGQTRTIGKIYGVITTESVRNEIIAPNELDEVFHSGIKKAMDEFKNNYRENVGRKAYEWFIKKPKKRRTFTK